jgi:hypothetical protein
MSEITTEQETAIREWIHAHPTLSTGIGTAESACSVAAINLALTGELTDRVPDCMSEVIGRWVIGVQDRMPAEIRNSGAWRELLPLAAGTGRSHEAERTAMVLDWMWGTALPLVQPLAYAHGFGTAWRQMTTDRTASAASAAYAAASATLSSAAIGASFAARRTGDTATSAAYTAASAASAASAAASATLSSAASTASAAYAAASATLSSAAYAAIGASFAARRTGDTATSAAYTAALAANAAWTTLDPIGLLRQLIAITDPRAAEMTR